MSGLLGVINYPTKEVVEFERSLRERLCRFSWNTWDWWTSPDGRHGLGRVDIGIFNPEPQPVSSPDEQVFVFFSGELYRTDELRRELELAGITYRRHDDPELTLYAYLSLGKKFAKRLEGAFHLAILDLRRQELLIANDRFGLRPLYYTQYQDKFAFAPEVKALIMDSAFTRNLSLTAVAEYMRFQQLLGEKTFIEDIYLLPPASLLTYNLSANQLAIEAYWHFFEIPQLSPQISYQDIVEESAHLFQQAINTLAADDKRIGLYLTGGLDSRLIAGSLAKINSHFPTVSYGDPHSVDVRLAKQVATLLGTEHHVFPFVDGKWVQQYAALHLALTEGHHSWIHSHGISTLETVRSFLDVNLTGWGVDTGLGGHYWDPLLNEAIDDSAFNSYLFYLYNQKYQWPGLNEAESYDLFHEPVRLQMIGLAFESFREEINRLQQYGYEQRAEYFNILNHNRRLTQYFVIFNSSHFENRFLGYDYQLFDFVYSFPLKQRPNRRLQQDVIEFINPQLALIPQAKNGLLFTRRRSRKLLHHATTRLKQRFNRHLINIFPMSTPLYADYENWLRHELREWAEGILFDGLLANRGIFNPNAVKSLFDRHMSGRELHTIGKIAPIMTFEMMMRQFFD